MMKVLELLKTDTSVAFMAELYKTQGLQQGFPDAWLKSLAFYKNPSGSMLTSALVSLSFLTTSLQDTNCNFFLYVWLQTFITEETPKKSAIFGVSSLVNAYCKSKLDCASHPEVQAIVVQFERLLGEKCNVGDQHEEDFMILALKGIANTKTVIHSAPVLERCYLDSDNPIPVRLASIDAIKGLSCQTNKFQTALLRTFSNSSMDSEIRIGTYLALIGCPSDLTVERVVSLIDTEPVNQGKYAIISK